MLSNFSLVNGIYHSLLFNLVEQQGNAKQSRPHQITAHL